MTAYTLHKWLAVTVGAFFLIWLISGIVMVSGSLFSVSMPSPTPAPLDISKISVSPAEAIAGLAKTDGALPQAISVTLKQVADVAVYEIVTANEERHLIHAQSGQPFTITPEIAGQIVRRYAPSQTPVLQGDLVTSHSLTYPWGPLPVYRFMFDHDRSIVYYVALHDGGVQHEGRWRWIQGAIASLHTFQPLKLIVKQDIVRDGLLVLMAIVGIGASVTGYYLAVPRWRR
jgi:hypothetical protein